MAPYAPDADTRFDTGVGDVEVDLNGITQDSEISTSVDQEARCDEERDINLHATHTGKYGTYDLVVDPDQEDRASEIKLCSFKRPHMRAFHYAWWCYHVSFFMWFAITPLLSEVKITLDLTKEQIWSSSISAGIASIFLRFLLGPFVDKFGPRMLMAILLVCSAIPTGLTGLVQSATGLTILRFFIGAAGSTFVMVMFWTSTMFTKEWVGTANAIAGGWGNLGAATTQVLMGSILFPLFKSLYNGNSEKAWRTVCAVPAAMGLITAFCVVKFTDDLPKGNFSKLKKTDQMKHVNVIEAFQKGILNCNTWVLSVQYACCFGVGIVMNNAAALYFKDQFGLSTESAAAVASIFAWMDLFARGLGGYISDKANDRHGMRGRLGCQSFVLFMGGCFVVLFAFCTNLGAAIVVLVIFSIFVQAGEGTTYGIVPYVNPPFTGSLSGIVGAGGSVGSVLFGVCFRQMTAKRAFLSIGIIMVASSFLSIFVFVKGHPGLVCRTSVPDDSSKTEDEGSVSKDTNTSLISKESDSEQTASDTSV